MAQKLKGVGGVLGNLLSPEPTAKTVPAVSLDEASQDAGTIEQPATVKAEVKSRPKALVRTQSRRGRPPGKKSGEVVEKEKVTLRLSKELMDEYREWSWEERCQLGELVERALSQYRKQRSRTKGD